ncbi:MAG: ARMT1-like domain-containing protein [Caldilineales bacterium]
MKKSSIIFGAGNVGRGFLGQLFSESGYEVIFADVDAELIAAMAARGRYTIRLVDNDLHEEATVAPVRGLLATDTEAVADAVATASIATTAVGVRALPFVAPAVAAGIARRATAGNQAPLNIIICENLKDAATTFRGMVAKHLPASLRDFLDTHIGFVDTVIGRMVPPLSPEQRAVDPTLIIVEPYKELPVDRAAWIGPVPPVVGLEACENFPAYTARKLYIHNCGHAVLAYLGYRRGHEFGWQALEDPTIRPLFEEALAESKAGIVAAHGVDPAWLDAHIADLTRRFANRAGRYSATTGARSAAQAEATDRLVGAARLVERTALQPEALSWAVAAALCFDDARDPLALAMQERLAEDGVDAVLQEVSGIAPDGSLANLVRVRYRLLRESDWPPPLMTWEPGSFARGTIVARKPQLIAQVIADNDYPASVLAALEDLRDEIATHPMQPLAEDAPDREDWNRVLADLDGARWQETRWYFAETFFYRKLLEATGYFQPGPLQRLDPFAPQKRKQEAAGLAQLAAGWSQLASLPPGERFEALLHSSLWGNRADLSNLTITQQAQAGLATRGERHLLLIDDTAAVHGLLARGVHRVDFICDNVGLDSTFDLVLADFLLSHGWAERVVFHLKDRPFFVSDAMVEDIAAVSAQMARHEDDDLRALAGRLEQAQSHGALALRTDPFWASFRMFYEMPEHLAAELAASELVVVKGDVNYRRLLGDKHWPHATRLEQVTAYFPAPFVTLRTLKGEIMVGLAPGHAMRLQAEDPDWLIDGKRGVIQMVDGRQHPTASSTSISRRVRATEARIAKTTH